MFPYSRIIFLVVVLGLLSACATSYDKRGVYHRVRGGESIYRVAGIYGTDAQSLAEYNNVLNPDDIQPGTRLYIPPRKKAGAFKRLPFGESVGKADVPAEESVKKKKGKAAARYVKAENSSQIQTYRGRFIWPVDGRVVSPFGYRDGRRHDGVDLSGSDGTPIHAAAAGKVVFAGSMRGYGNLVLIRHKDNLFTAYSHNSSNKVHKGQIVEQGEVIAKVGHTGRATGPHLHFEIRHGQTSRNPLFFLPDRAADDEGRALRAQALRREAKGKSLASSRKSAVVSKSKGKKTASTKSSAKGKSNARDVQKTHPRR